MFPCRSGVGVNLSSQIRQKPMKFSVGEEKKAEKVNI